MKKTKEQERMVAAMTLAGVLADEPAVLLCIQRMLETPWFAPLPRGARKKAKTAVDRLLRLVDAPTSKAGRPGTDGALFDLRAKPKVTKPIQVASPESTAWRCPEGIHHDICECGPYAATSPAPARQDADAIR